MRAEADNVGMTRGIAVEGRVHVLLSLEEIEIGLATEVRIAEAKG